MYRSTTSHSKNLNHQNFHVWNSDGQGDLHYLTVVIPDAVISAVPFCSYTVCDAVRSATLLVPNSFKIRPDRSVSLVRLWLI